MVNRDRLVNNFIEMVKVDSPSKKEREMANWLVNYLKERNIEAVIDNAGDKIGGNCGNLVKLYVFLFQLSHIMLHSKKYIQIEVKMTLIKLLFH